MKKATIIISLVIAFALFSMIVYALGTPPKIALYITDTNQAFDVTVQGHKVQASYGETDSPDIIMKMNTSTFVEIFNATDYKTEAYAQYQKGNVEIEVIADYSTLALKGYKAIFDSFGAMIGK